MTVARQQLVEIAKALSFNARVLIMDEPTSALNETEVEHLFAVIDDLKANGVGIVYITHKMDEVKRIADRVTVMRDGQYIDTLPAEITSDVDNHPDDGRARTGRPAPGHRPRHGSMRFCGLPV